MLNRSQYRLLLRIAHQYRNYSFTSRCLKKKDIRFSESGAYQGVEKMKNAVDLNEPLYIPNYYDSVQFRNARLLVAVLSIFALFIYFGILRERSDLDMILEASPDMFSASMQRKSLVHQINTAREKGEPTESLQAELDYVEVREAAIKAKLQNRKSNEKKSTEQKN